MNELVVEDMFAMYVDMKRQAVDALDDPDLPIIIFAGAKPLTDHGEEAMSIVVDGARHEVAGAFAHLMNESFIPYWTAVLMDSYSASEGAVPDEYRHAGGLGEMFRAGIGDVKQALTITAVDHAGAIYSNSRTYWFDDDDDIWFDDEAGPPDKDPSGPMVDLLREVVSLWGMSPGEAEIALLKRSPRMN